MDRRKTGTIRISSLLAVLFWIAVWQIASMAVGKELILPGPVSVIKALWGLVRQGSFWTSILMTVLRIMLGYAAGVALGCLLTFGCCRSKILNSLFSPIIRMVRATPVASFIILAMLWMSKGGVPVLMSALIVAPVVWGNLMEAYAGRDMSLDQMATAYRLGRCPAAVAEGRMSDRPWIRLEIRNSRRGTQPAEACHRIEHLLLQGLSGNSRAVRLDGIRDCPELRS